MTPRQANVAFVLEGASGVIELYSLGPAAHASGDLEFAVKLEHGGDHIALAHYALLRVLSHDECKSVLFFEVDLPPRIRERAARIELSAAEREDARRRVPERTDALEQRAVPRPRAPDAVGFRVLIVDTDVEVYRSVVAAFGAGAERVIEPDPFAAFWRARSEPFDVILCDARAAFGRQGFLAELVAFDPFAARRVVLVARDGERELLMASLDELRCWNSYLCRPVDPDTLREILRTGSVVQQWSIPVLAPRGSALSEPTKRADVRRVLVVDDDPSTSMLLAAASDGAVEVVVTSDEWEAVDTAGEADLALVVCSVSMRTLGGTPFYRLLWNAHPEIKRRFVFITRADAAPTSTLDGRTAAVVERPITRATLFSLLERFERQ